MAERRPISAYGLDEVEALDLTEMTDAELKAIHQRGQDRSMQIHADDLAATKGLLRNARRWEALADRATAELGRRSSAEADHG